MYVVQSMIEALIATGLAGVVTVLAYTYRRGRYNYNDDASVESRIKDRVVNVWKEYKEHGLIDEEEYIYLNSLNDHYRPNRYSVNDDDNKNKDFIDSIIRRLDSIEGRFDLLDRSLREYMNNMNRSHTIDKTNSPYMKKVKRISKRPRIEYETSYHGNAEEDSSISSYDKGDKNEFDDLEEIKRRINDMIKRLDND